MKKSLELKNALTNFADIEVDYDHNVFLLDFLTEVPTTEFLKNSGLALDMKKALNRYLVHLRKETDWQPTLRVQDRMSAKYPIGYALIMQLDNWGRQGIDRTSFGPQLIRRFGIFGISKQALKNYSKSIGTNAKQNQLLKNFVLNIKAAEKNTKRKLFR